MTDTPTEFESMIQQGWTEHTENAQGVAQRLEAGLGGVSSPAEAASYMSLVSHVLGDHLGQREQARALCESAAEAAGEESGVDVYVYLSAARRLAGDHEGAAAAQRLAGQDPALGVRIGMIVAQGLAHAGEWLEANNVFRAMLAATVAMEPGHSAERTVAVVSNNVASELLGLKDRDEIGSALMLDAAKAAYTHWSRVGTWVNKERGEYLLSLVYREIGEVKAARKWAERGLDTIVQGDPDEVVDQAFMHVARAAACRDSGDLEAQAESLTAASTLASTFDDPGLIAWFRREHSKAV